MKSLLIANWKMNQNHRSAADFFATFAQESSKVDWKNLVEVGIAPPYPYLEAVGNRSLDLGLLTGAQNVHQQDNGAYTGEIGAAMLKDIGCEFVIVGHSERRAYFEESSELVASKAQKAVDHQLIAVVCCGETAQQREAEETLEVIRRQLAPILGLKLVPEKLVIAYEPVWSIGTGKTATPEMAQQAHAFIRSQLIEAYGEQHGGAVRIIYGGSVKSGNIKELMAQQDINGGLVGGASLDATEFAQILSGTLS